MPIHELVFIILLSLSLGLLMGIIGAGGGGLYVIILLVFLHQSVETAIGTALILSTVTLASAAWQYLRQKEIEWNYLRFLLGFGVIGVAIGSFGMQYIDKDILKVVIICVFIISATASLLRTAGKPGSEKSIPAAGQKLPWLILLGLISGTMIGGFGLSGGIATSSALIGFFHFPTILAIGTTTLITLGLNFTGALLHIGNQHIDYSLLAFLGSGSIIGSAIGAKLVHKINRRALTISLGLLTIASAVYLAFSKK